MNSNSLEKYINKKKELNTTKRILKRLKEKPRVVGDYAKDYRTGYPHNIKLEGYDVITNYKINMYEKKKSKLENEIKDELDNLNKIIEQIEDPLAKSIFEYKYISDMNFKEIAIKTNNTYENVKKIHWRTLKKLSPFVPK